MWVSVKMVQSFKLVTQKVNKIPINKMLKDEIEKKTNKKGLKTKKNSNQKNKHKIWYKNKIN